MAIERVYKQQQSPKLFDRVIQAMQDRLSGLAWLDHVFGRCERLVKMSADGRRVYSPNVYKGDEEYILLTPDNTELGNYCFFVMEEPETVRHAVGERLHVRSPFSLILWVDMRTVGATYDDRNTDELKDAVLRLLDGSFLREGAVTLQRVYERSENVFQGFSLDEVENQYLMSPYWGMRLTGEMVVLQDCDNG